jgi:hypothetical protein
LPSCSSATQGGLACDLRLRGKASPRRSAPKRKAANRAKAASPGDTPIDHYNHALSKFGDALQAMDQAFNAVSKVAGDNA